MNSPKKLNSWKSFDFGQKSTNTPKSIPNSDKISEKRSAPATIPRKENTKKIKTFNFERKLSPKEISDLAVHPKKLQELQDSLLDTLSQKSNIHPQILLLSGPSGSGKSTSLRVVCRDFGVALEEWTNPIDQEYEITRENQMSQFLDFLISSKWGSLFQTEDNHVTVVKDFPNSIIRQPEQFHGILEECWYKTKMPIIFICTEANNNNINLIKNLFPDNVISRFRIRHIEFNACAPTLMKNALKRAHLLIKDHLDLFSPPPSEVIEAIVATSMGDIRNAMNQFYLASLRGGGKVPLIAENKQIIGAKKKKRSKNDAKIKSMERDETLGLFHGLGRVLNPKWIEINGMERLNCDVEKLIDEFSTQPSIFMLFLFENYLKYFGAFNDAKKAAEILSFSIKFLDNFVDRHDILLYGLWVSVLGLMVSNKHKVSKWTQIRGPVKVEKKIVSDISLIGYDSSDMFYCNLINSVKNGKNVSKSDETGFDGEEMLIEDFD